VGIFSNIGSLSDSKETTASVAIAAMTGISSFLLLFAYMGLAVCGLRTCVRIFRNCGCCSSTYKHAMRVVPPMTRGLSVSITLVVSIYCLINGINKWLNGSNADYSMMLWSTGICAILKMFLYDFVLWGLLLRRTWKKQIDNGEVGFHPPPSIVADSISERDELEKLVYKAVPTTIRSDDGQTMVLPGGPPGLQRQKSMLPTAIPTRSATFTSAPSSTTAPPRRSSTSIRSDTAIDPSLLRTSTSIRGAGPSLSRASTLSGPSVTRSSTFNSVTTPVSDEEEKDDGMEANTPF
jgi:hypothetical protein